MTTTTFFSDTIAAQKYRHDKADGTKESWREVAERVGVSVIKPYLPQIADYTINAIDNREFLPGGRYLYAAGRPYHQVNNCQAGNTQIITSKGIMTLKELVGREIEIVNRFGQWEKATVHAFGVQRLYKITFHNGDVIHATAGHRWWQANGSRITTAEIERVPLIQAPVPQLDEEGIRHGIIFGDGFFHKNKTYSRVILCTKKKEELAKCFDDDVKQIKVGNNAALALKTIRQTKAGLTVNLQPAKYKQLPDPANCSPAYARGFIAGLTATDGSTRTSSVTISCNGKHNAEIIRNLAVLGGCVVNGISEHKRTKPTYIKGKLAVPNDDLYNIRIKPFSAPIIRPDQIADIDARKLTSVKMWLDVVSVEDTGIDEEVYCCVVPGSESFLLANGLITSNCFLMSVEDSREGWADLMRRATHALMTGGGIGVVYNKLREEGALVRGMGGFSTGPLSPMQMVNEAGRHIMQGGSRRSAIWAGLIWNHPDIKKFIQMKNWSKDIRKLKDKDFNFPAAMDMTNISVILDDAFFFAYLCPNHPEHKLAQEVYWMVVTQMCKTAEPGFSIDVGKNAGEHLRNACTEVTSRDNNDVCNLGSINLARVHSFDQFCEMVYNAIGFLLCGTLYSKIPYAEVGVVRDTNRRLGLGLMGMAEWLLVRGKRYGPDDELEKWLQAYADISDKAAYEWSRKLGVNCPIKTRALAPTGTISIVGETTGGIEPILAVAIKRRYLKNKTWHYQYIIDGAAKRLIDKGVDPNLIEDAYELSEDIERRLQFQAFVQRFVDMGISSTLNLSSWGSSVNNEDTVKSFGNTLFKYLPYLRGVTAYPDGARGGQPMTKVPYSEALKYLGTEYEEGGTIIEETTNNNICSNGVCGV